MTTPDQPGRILLNKSMHDGWIQEFPGEVFVVFDPTTDGSDILGAARTLWEARRILKVATGETATTQAPSPTDEQLARAAYKGYDDYWTEDCTGRDLEAWAASAKAVLALAAPVQSTAAIACVSETRCAVRGLLRPNAMCGYVIVGGKQCGAPASFACKYKATQAEPQSPGGAGTKTGAPK